MGRFHHMAFTVAAMMVVVTVFFLCVLGLDMGVS